METVNVMRGFGVVPSTITAAIGPSIGPCCYQVADPVRDAFLAMTPDAAGWFSPDEIGKWRLDLWQANVEQLVMAGVHAEAIERLDVCTSCHLDRCYSYRREGAGGGRLVAAIRAGGPSGVRT
jgi:copper oxidase (laccase) domain-containing protein